MVPIGSHSIWLLMRLAVPSRRLGRTGVGTLNLSVPSDWGFATQQEYSSWRYCFILQQTLRKKTDSLYSCNLSGLLLCCCTAEILKIEACWCFLFQKNTMLQVACVLSQCWFYLNYTTEVHDRKDCLVFHIFPCGIAEMHNTGVGVHINLITVVVCQKYTT